MTRVAVMGTGNWGTAFACHPRRRRVRRHHVGAAPGGRRRVNAGCNHDYLPELRLPAAVRATVDPARPLDQADIVVLAVPSQTLRDNLDPVGRRDPRGRRRRLPDEGRRARHDDAHE